MLGKRMNFNILGERKINKSKNRITEENVQVSNNIFI